MAADDDLDVQLRAAMKTLDSQEPSGYFDALPGRVLARLAQGEAQSEMPQMQAGDSSATDPAKQAAEAPSTGVPPDDNSGLHDIRNLAQTAKQRISSKRITTSPVRQSNEDILASASGSWKNLALPQPAKMISLPELDQLPPAKEVKRAKAVTAKAATASAVTTSASTAMPMPLPLDAAGSAPVRRAPSHRNRNLAISGAVLAAAAGVAIFVAVKPGADAKSADQAPAATSASAERADHSGAAGSAAQVAMATPPAPPKPTVEPIDDSQADKKADTNGAPATGGDVDRAIAPAGAATSGAGGGGMTAPPAAPPTTPAAIASAPKHANAKAPPSSRGSKTASAQDVVAATPAPQATTTPAKDEKTKKPGGDGAAADPSFDALLKEAGVNDKQAAPKQGLDKKELSPGDFKQGMAGISGKAQACFSGTQGTASVKLTIAPSGKVTKVSVSGMFAGKPEADCVMKAVRTASFPPWDGGSQTMGYSFLLSE